MKACVFIDGFNLFHAIDCNWNYHKYKWLDLQKLSRAFLPSADQLIDIYYFTAYATWDQDKVRRHQLYVQALESTGVKVVLGAFRRKTTRCFLCHKEFWSYVEKETDVNIAIKLFQLSIKGAYEKAYVISGDSDLIPAIEAVKETFPNKQIGVIIPIGRRAELLKQVTHFHMKMKEQHLASCQFPDKIELSSKTTLVRPPAWR
jgi:uncharacterized LabA/DUF88 family protein